MRSPKRQWVSATAAAPLASFWDRLQKLTMVGVAYLGVDPTSFILGFIAAELSAWLSKEGLLMIKTITDCVLEYANRQVRRGITALEAYLPSGDTPLMSL
jgi:hypothetical protein